MRLSKIIYFTFVLYEDLRLDWSNENTFRNHKFIHQFEKMKMTCY